MPSVHARPLPCFLALTLLAGASSARLVAAAEPTARENPLLSQLLETGIDLTPQVRAQLPPPRLPDALQRSQEKEIVTQIAGRYGWSAFVRDAAVAPFVLQQNYIKNEQGERVGHAVDLWFIVHGQLALLDDKKLAEDVVRSNQAADAPENGVVRELTDDELASHQLTDVDKNAQRWILGEFPLLNRVYVRGVVQAHQTRTDTSRVVAWTLDSRFNDSADLNSRWWPIERTELGERRRGDPHPYQGYAGYLKITSLQEPAGALLCEAHIVFQEPPDWFHGSSFLRSKTPMMVKENVDKLRRQLAQWQDEQQ